jgi:hypothetical protein
MKRIVFFDTAPCPLLRNKAAYVKEISTATSFAAVLIFYKLNVFEGRGTRGRGSWLRHCATTRKVTGLIPYGVIGH